MHAKVEPMALPTLAHARRIHVHAVTSLLTSDGSDHGVSRPTRVNVRLGFHSKPCNLVSLMSLPLQSFAVWVASVLQQLVPHVGRYRCHTARKGSTDIPTRPTLHALWQALGFSLYKACRFTATRGRQHAPSPVLHGSPVASANRAAPRKPREPGSAA